MTISCTIHRMVHEAVILCLHKTQTAPSTPNTHTPHTCADAAPPIPVRMRERSALAACRHNTEMSHDMHASLFLLLLVPTLLLSLLSMDTHTHTSRSPRLRCFLMLSTTNLNTGRKDARSHVFRPLSCANSSPISLSPLSCLLLQRRVCCHLRHSCFLPTLCGRELHDQELSSLLSQRVVALTLRTTSMVFVRAANEVDCLHQRFEQRGRQSRPWHPG